MSIKTVFTQPLPHSAHIKTLTQPSQMFSLYLPGIVWQLGSTLVMQAMLWATANVITMMADPSALLTETMTVMQLVTVVSTMVQAGGLMPAWQLTWMDGITVGATAGWLTVSTGGRGTYWLMDELENVTPSREWRWRQDHGTFSGRPEDKNDRSHWKTYGTVDYCNNHVSHSWKTCLHWQSLARCFSHCLDITLFTAAFVSFIMQMAANGKKLHYIVHFFLLFIASFIKKNKQYIYTVTT